MHDPSRRELLEGAAAGAVLVGALGAGAVAAAAAETVTLAEYIVRRLREQGAEVLFGVPGATCDPLFAAARSAALPIVVTASDLEAGYAADGYARFRGLGAVAVTYGVGTLGLVQVIAGALAERSPIVVVDGGPTAEDLRLQREERTLFSHSCGRDAADLTMFREVTAWAGRVERAQDAPRLVDEALRVARAEQRPVFLEVPKDLWNARCPAPGAPLDTSPPPATGSEGELAARVVARLRSAARPALLIGVEVRRAGLQDEVQALVERLGVPWATTLLAKSVIPEQTAGFVGVYTGARAVPAVREVIEGADAVLALGCVMGRQLRTLVTDSSQVLMRADGGELRLGRDPAGPASLAGLVRALATSDWRGDPARLAATRPVGASFDERRSSVPKVAAGGASRAEPGLTCDEVIREVSALLDERFLAVIDTSLSMYPAAELDITGRDGFLCNAVWQSIGFSVAAAVGASFAQERRPVVICGDGGFQMTAQALSTMARHQLRAVVVVLDNGLYGIEQWLLQPRWFAEVTPTEPIPYLALHRWRYDALAKAMGVEQASAVDTVEGLRAALRAAVDATGPVFVSARVRPHDLPEELRS